MNIINFGDRYEIYSDSLRVFTELPAKTYAVCFNKMSGFSLQSRSDMAVKEKVYGDHEAKVTKVFRSFSAFDRNLGVLLSGNKGIGKSLFVKMICQKANEVGLPVIIVDAYIPGIASYLESIEQEVVVIFDEFDKTFGDVKRMEGDVDPQTSLLTMFDGVSTGKKLFVITCNEIRKISEFLVNRPGRFHYHFRFNYPSDKEIEEYLKDKLDEQFYDQIPSVISFSKRIGLTYDCLRAIAFEINCGETFKRAIEDLNIVNTEGEQYNLTLYFKDGGTLVCRREYIDMYGWESVYIDFRDKSSKMALEVHFELADCIYDGFTGNMQIDGQAVEVSSYYQKEYKDREISRITVVRCGQRSIHYAV